MNNIKTIENIIKNPNDINIYSEFFALKNSKWILVKSNGQIGALYSSLIFIGR